MSQLRVNTEFFSSSDEEEYQRDLQLERDIHQLERTLNNFHTDSDTSRATHRVSREEGGGRREEVIVC